MMPKKDQQRVGDPTVTSRLQKAFDSLSTVEVNQVIDNKDDVIHEMMT
jgi:hypothetical protein